VAALENAANRIRVNAVCPGYTGTPMILEPFGEQLDDIVSGHPMGRLADPAEIANMIVFLLSEEAGFMTGSVHQVDGGVLLL
jgi:NAD(P)-dependent dehydrogenase (short-subunit alcohol dehydrogenase family)